MINFTETLFFEMTLIEYVQYANLLQRKEADIVGFVISVLKGLIIIALGLITV